MSNHLLEIANALGALYAQRKDLQIQLTHQEIDYSSRVLTITPQDGYAGKNEEQRALAKKRAETEDEALANIRTQIDQLQESLSECEGNIETLETERRGLEWSIRDRLVDALAGKRNTNGRELPPDVVDFDDAADDEAVESELDGLPF